MKKINLFKNYIYYTAIEFYKIILPIATIPYITRVLGCEAIGAYAYTNSIKVIFVLFAMLGISTYGSKMIASTRNNFEKRNAVFWELIFLNLFNCIIACSFYLLFVQFAGNNLKLLYYIQAITFITTVIDTSWFFVGLEDFKRFATRNFFIRTLGVISIFIFIKEPKDLPFYVFIISFTNLLGAFYYFYYLKGYVKFQIPDVKKMFSHFLPMFYIFIPLFISFLYIACDKIMIGNLAGLKEAGIYEMANRIIMAVIALSSSLTAVMMPRISNIVANMDYKKIETYFKKSLYAISYFSIPVSIGLIAISNEFTPWFFGPKFAGISILITTLSLTILLYAYKSIVYDQILIPLGKEKTCAAIIFIGLIVKIFINFMLIPTYKAFGAAMSTLATEAILTSVLFSVAVSFINFKSFLSEFFVEFSKFTISATLFYIPIKILGNYMDSSIITTSIQVCLGVLIYTLSINVLNSKTHKFVLNNIKKLFLSKFLLNKTDSILVKEKV